MREHVAAGRWDDAAERAKDAAPYVHPRLSAVAVSGEMEHRHYVARLPQPTPSVAEWQGVYGHLKGH